MNWLWIKIKQGAWKAILAVVALASLTLFLYNLVRPTKNRTHFLGAIRTNIVTAIKENEIRATLEKDKIGIIKKAYDQRINDTKKISDVDERLRALIRLHEELDLQGD